MTRGLWKFRDKINYSKNRANQQFKTRFRTSKMDLQRKLNATSWTFIKSRSRTKLCASQTCNDAPTVSFSISPLLCLSCSKPHELFLCRISSAYLIAYRSAFLLQPHAASTQDWVVYRWHVAAHWTSMTLHVDLHTQYTGLAIKLTLTCPKQWLLLLITKPG